MGRRQAALDAARRNRRRLRRGDSGERVAGQLEAGVVEEASRAWSQPRSETARNVLGLEEFATLPPDDAAAAVVAASQQLARYQRKWLRRLPGAITLAGDRGSEVIADDLMSLA